LPRLTCFQTSPRYALDFNISHDDEVVMLAVTSTATPPGIGIDVMRVNRAGSDADGLEEVLLEQVRTGIFRNDKPNP
jgi:hypothetical protein